MTGAGHVLTALVTPSSVAGSTAWSDVTGSTVTNDPTDSEVFNRAQVGIAAITVDATDTTGKTVYVGIGGFGGQGLAPLAWPNVPALYGSTDAGSTWQNLTNDLPNTPVNAVLVDPEDPAIIYVGTDVGVYVTTSVTQCADVQQNCWSAYGAGLPAVRVTTLSAVDASGEKWLRAGTKGARRVAGRAGEHSVEDHDGDSDHLAGHADLCCAGGGHHQRCGEPDDPECGRDCSHAGRTNAEQQRLCFEWQPVPGNISARDIMRDRDRVCADGDRAAQWDRDHRGKCAGWDIDGQCAGHRDTTGHDGADAAASGFWIGADRADEPQCNT